MIDTVITDREPTLNKGDRCDACGAAAAVRVHTMELGVFLFCKHDFEKNKKFIPNVTRVHDETSPLTTPNREAK